MTAIELNAAEVQTTDGSSGRAAQTSLFRRGTALGLWLAQKGAFVAPLITRLAIGYAFYEAGKGKWGNLENTTGFFESLGIPAPAANAAFVATLELVGGLALMLGLGTRLFALGLSGTMAVALLTAHRSEFYNALRGAGDAGVTDVVPFVYLTLLLWLVCFGPGALSLDRMLARWWKLEPATSGTSAAKTGV